MPTTVADIQQKIIVKMEEKFRGGVTAPKLMSHFKELDRDQDGFLSLTEFKSVIERLGSALSNDEMEFLFGFWDTMAGQQPPQGAVQVALCVQDLLASLPQYSTGFNSGAEMFKNKGGRGNKPSQEGGIFGGGSYEADARMDGPTPRGGSPQKPLPPMAMGQPAAQAPRPKGNQSSIEGGIFGAAPPAPAPVQNQARANRSNQSSIEGGIFGEAPPPQVQQRHGRNSNQSSIPGGIFG